MTRRCILAFVFVAATALKPAAAASCSISASSIVFGNYSGGTIDVTGTLMVFCTSGTAFHIGLNAGNTSGATITNRLMFGGNGGSNTLGYQLFNDAARTINWGNSSGTNWVSGTGTGNNQQFTIYARMPANEVSPQGNYTDTITASITGSFTTGIGSFSVTSTVVPGCTVGATNLAFGAYTNALINSTSTITVTCPSGTTYQVGLNAGTASGATVTNRNMTGPGGALLGYKLFRNAAHTLNWGSTVGSDTLAGSGNGSAQLLSVYGQLPGGQSARPGNYSDTITVTITY